MTAIRRAALGIVAVLLSLAAAWWSDAVKGSAPFVFVSIGGGRPSSRESLRWLLESRHERTNLGARRASGL
ncbi:MAG: hypothetical protein KY476_25005 [Planctomycetes bacterium]|nr:hypothetical protein [Planctomycetota bacterium]